jgi:hypothetical protein
MERQVEKVKAKRSDCTRFPTGAELNDIILRAELHMSAAKRGSMQGVQSWWQCQPSWKLHNSMGESSFLPSAASLKIIRSSCSVVKLGALRLSGSLGP